MFMLPASSGYLPPINPVAEQTIVGRVLTDSQNDGTQIFRITVGSTIWTVRYIDPRVQAQLPTGGILYGPPIPVPAQPGQTIRAIGTTASGGAPDMNASSVSVVGSVYDPLPE